MVLIFFIYILSSLNSLLASSSSRVSSSIYEDRNLFLRPVIKERLAIVTEIVTFLQLHKLVCNDIIERRSQFKDTIINLHWTMSKLSDLLLGSEMKRCLLPEISDQKDIYSKILAKYRIDLLNPWATHILGSHLPETIKSTSQMDIIRKFGLKVAITQSSKFQSSIKTIFTPFFIDSVGRGPILFHSDPADVKISIRSFFYKFLPIETITLLRSLIHKKFGISVNSLDDINNRFHSKSALPINKNSLWNPDFYVQAPFIEFQLKKD